MEHNGGSLESLILVVAVSFIIPILLYQLRLKVLPVVVAEILAGLLIGKSGFNIVADDPWVKLLSLLGFIYLMFLSGLEIDFGSFRRSESGPRKRKFTPLTISFSIFTGIFLVSGMLSAILVAGGFIDRVFLMTLIIGTISLGVVVPVLKERRLLGNELGQTLLLITVLADFFTMILLAVYVCMLSSNIQQMLLLLLFFISVASIYFLVKRFASRKVFQVLSESSVQFGTRAIFALLLAIVFLSESLGVENILGAFLAGVIVSLLRPRAEFVHQLESFGYGFLIPIFFVMVGVNLELKPLFSDAKIIMLIPVLLVMMFVAKMVPMLLLRKWYGWREVISSGILHSSKLSLVIAAATLALDLHIIDSTLHSALILVAIISCVVFPVLYSKLSSPGIELPKKISFVGVNHVTWPVARDLMREEHYELHLFTDNSSSLGREEAPHPRATLHNVSRLHAEDLDNLGAFEADIIVIATSEDLVNIRVAQYLQTKGNHSQRVLVRIEDPNLQKEWRKFSFDIFSTLYAARTVLRALVETPSVVKLISEADDTIYEITVHNKDFHMTILSKLPALDKILILRIYRGTSFLIPHGSTEIRKGDRLLVSGKSEDAERFRRLLE